MKKICTFLKFIKTQGLDCTNANKTTGHYDEVK